MKTTLMLIAVLGLNFCYGQEAAKQTKIPFKDAKPNPASAHQDYVYSISGFKSGYKPGYRIDEHEFVKGRSITVRNYNIIQLFKLALEAGMPECAIDSAHILIDVREPKKLQAIHCFKLVVPFYQTDNFYIIMQRCLNEQFPEYKVKMEVRSKESFMVIRDREY